MACLKKTVYSPIQKDGKNVQSESHLKDNVTFSQPPSTIHRQIEAFSTSHHHRQPAIWAVILKQPVSTAWTILQCLNRALWTVHLLSGVSKCRRIHFSAHLMAKCTEPHQITHTLWPIYTQAHTFPSVLHTGRCQPDFLCQVCFKVSCSLYWVSGWGSLSGEWAYWMHYHLSGGCGRGSLSGPPGLREAGRRECLMQKD